MTSFSALIATHAILTTIGYAGLIATNLWLLLLCRVAEPAIVAQAVSTWRALARVFGPMLGAGVLLGFGLAAVAHVSLSSLWLVITYGLVFVAIGVQASVMVPWQLRADAILASGGAVSTRPVAIVLAVFCVAYVGILSLMLLRPV